MKGAIKYCWNTLREKINASQEHRARGFSKEDTDKTKEIIEYKKDNPDASQRQIAEALNCSVGKVNKALNTSTTTSTTTSTSTSTSTTVNVNVNAHANTEDEKKREEDLTEKEIRDILNDYKNKVKYADIQRKYNLGFPVKQFIDKRAKILLRDFEEINAKSAQQMFESPEYIEIGEYIGRDAYAVNGLCKMLETTTNDFYSFVINNPQCSFENFKNDTSGKNYVQYLKEKMNVGK